MILRGDRRKRKHDAAVNKEHEVSENDDKYLAYRKKSSRRAAAADKKTEDVEIVDLTSINSTDNSSGSKKAKKRKKKEEAENSNVEAEVKSTTESLVSIVAKPILNKAAVELNVALNEAQKKLQKKSRKKKRGANIRINKSQLSVNMDMKKSEQSISEPLEAKSDATLNASTLTVEENSTTNILPIIVEANLKKSSKSYIPKALQDSKEDDVKDQHNLPANSKKSDEDAQKKVESSSTKTNVEDSKIEDPKISSALQEFYEEVTQGFDSLVDKKSNKRSKKKKKKKNNAALTMDESVKDPKNLIDIVHENTVVIDNTHSMSHGNNARFFSLESKVILVLSPGTQFSILGKLKLKVLYGAVELYGSAFDPQNTVTPVEIYSPRGYSSISISTFSSEGTYDKESLWDALVIEKVDRSLKTKLHDAIQECQEGWSVLLLENFENTLTNFLHSNCTLKLFPKIENVKYSWCDPKRAECILQANFQFYNSTNEISIGPQWNESITKLLLNQWESKKSLCAMITGGKSVGKSTTARYLINNLLRHVKKVILLDLDPGQAELTTPGCLSLNVIDKPLLGPNFTHLKTPYYQLYLEDVSVSNCINKYFEYVKRLVEYLKSKKELEGYPVIVNTMGFCRGIGLDICVYLIKLIQPTNVVQISSGRFKNNFDFALWNNIIDNMKSSLICTDSESLIFQKTCNYELHKIPTVAEGKRQFETWNMEPRQQRELVQLAYLSQIIRNADDKSLCNFTSDSINNVTPYSLPFSAFYVSLTKSSISPTHILAAMNGNVVALCGADLDDETSQADKDTLTYPMVVIKPPACTCYGFGIVRGIDMKSRKIYINTPLRESELQHVNLLSGCAPVPFKVLHSGERAPYAGDKGELPTSKEARRGYFRVDQNKST